MPLFLPLLGIAAVATIIAGCSSDYSSPPASQCNYDDPKSICTLTFKPGAASIVQVKNGAQVDQFVAKESNLSPTQIYSNLCPEWRPSFALYTLPSKPYPKKPEELMVAEKSGIRTFLNIPNSDAPFVECSNDFQHEVDQLFDSEDPWKILRQDGSTLEITPNQIVEILKSEFPEAESIKPRLELAQVSSSPPEILLPFELNSRFNNTKTPSYGIIKFSLTSGGQTPSHKILSQIDIGHTSSGDYTSFYGLADDPQINYLYHSEKVIDSGGQLAGYSRMTPTYTFLGDFQQQQLVKLASLNYDPNRETTIEGFPWKNYNLYVTTRFTDPLYESNAVWMVHAPEIAPYPELWSNSRSLEKDLKGLHDQTADATLSKIDPNTGTINHFRIPLRGVRSFTKIPATNELALVGLAPPFKFKTITFNGKTIEVATGVPTLLRIASDGTTLQTLKLSEEHSFTTSVGDFSEDGLEFNATDDSFKAVFKNGQFELQSSQSPAEVSVQASLNYEEWKRDGTPLLLNSPYLDQSGAYYLFGGVNRDYTLVNAQSGKAISWNLPKSNDPANPRSLPCYNAAYRNPLNNGAISPDDKGDPSYITRTCAIEKGPGFLVPTAEGLRIYIAYGSEVLSYLIPSGMI